MRDLDVVVDEPDRPARERDEEDGQPLGCVLAQDQERNRGREDEQDAAHGRRPLLDQVSRGAVLANVLAVLPRAEEGDQLGADEDRDRHREDRCGEDSLHLDAHRLDGFGHAFEPQGP